MKKQRESSRNEIKILDSLSIEEHVLKDASDDLIKSWDSIVSKANQQEPGKSEVASALLAAVKELSFQNKQKEDRAAELAIANRELVFQNEEKEKRAAELVIANRELFFQNEQKEKRAAELVIANEQLAFQNEERERRAAELVVANEELVYQNKQRERRANELIVANNELALAQSRVKSLNDALEQKVLDRTRKLRKALNNEKSIVESKDKFVSIVSHEFRTPLSIISFAAESIRTYYAKLSAEEIDQKLSKIVDQANNLTVLLNDLLVIGKSEVGEIKVFPTRFNLKEFVESLIEEVHSADKGKHAIDFVYLSNVEMMTSDKSLLRNIINNILTNAIKFSPLDAPVAISISDAPGFILIEVTDKGIGIEEAEIPLIFLSFKRGSNATAISGSGLGLSIVKKSVDLLGGDIQVRSQIDLGSTFKIELPMK